MDEGFGGAVGMWGCGHCDMEMNKKSGGGDVRAEALAWDDEWDKTKNDCKGTALLQSNPT